jgi:HEAT repeat protein
MHALRSAAIAAFLAIALIGAAAQTSDTGEKTVEEAYLQESLETMIIKEQAHGDSHDLKLLALQYAKQAIEEGRINEEIRQSLEYLALESSTVVIREAGTGRLINDYPDVRKTACEYLGDFPTVESKDTLLRVALADREPMVIAAAVRSLGRIGMNENDEVTQTIAFIVNKYDILQPDNSLAFETLVAIERIAEANGGIKDPTIVRTVLRIADGSYITPVKQKAREVLDKLRKMSSGSSSSGGKKE